jgi:DNA-binding GntR family transcriptional regulator
LFPVYIPRCRGGGRALASNFARTAGQTAAQLIRERILSGALPPGTALNQLELAQALGMSRIPVRDALRSLAAEGLVEMKAHIPARVAPLSLDELEELYELRLVLEPRLCRDTLPELDQTDLDEMLEMLELMDGHPESESWLAWNDAFHDVMFRRSRRVRTVEIIRRARQQTGRYTRIHQGVGPSTVQEEHRLIYEAARAGQGRRLESLISAHLSDGYETMLRYVAKQESFQAEKTTRRAADEWSPGLG